MTLSQALGADSLQAQSAHLDARALFQGGGEMGALMASLDWATTPLGPVQAWPQSLRTSVSICLASRFPILVWWGADLVMLYNDAYQRILGNVKHPRAMGAAGRETWPEIWDIIGPMLAGVLERGEATYSEDIMLPLERKGFPEECYFTFSYSPIRDESGGIGGVFTAVSETTERVIGERRLRALRELAAQAVGPKGVVAVCGAAAGVLAGYPLDLPSAAVYRLDEGGKAHLAGTAGRHLELPAEVPLDSGDDGWSLGAAIRAGPLTVVDLPHAATAEPLGPGAWPGPSQQLALLPVTPPGGGAPCAILLVALSPNRPFDEDYQSFLNLVAGQIGAGVAEAIAFETERKRAEGLAQLDHAKTTFFSNVSHELRTPLTLILGGTEDALRADPPVLAGARLDAVHRNAIRLLKLVNTLLDFSRIEARRVRAHYEPVDLPAFTAELASSFRSAIERGGVALEVDTPPLPPHFPPVYVDRDMWEKIVLNLLSNAFKHTFAGSITVRMRALAGSVVLEVADTGVGVPADQLPLLFDRFHRVPNARSRTHEGTGIGLALVQELVTLHGGDVSVTSVVDRGTTFTVRVPAGTAHLQPEHLEEDFAASQQPVKMADAFLEEALRSLPAMTNGFTHATNDAAGAPLAAGARGRAGSVLVVDDNADMRDYLVRLLHERGWSVDAHANGASALEAAIAHVPDLILSDVMMPGLDGPALIAALRARPETRDVPVILLSARAGEEAQVEGLALGATDYLIKPFSSRELLARVESHLVRGRERTRLRELFAQAPVAIAVLQGPDFVYEVANDAYRRLIGPERDILGKPLRTALPELANQGITELLQRVYETGAPYVGEELSVRIAVADGQPLAQRFYTFVYQPVRDSSNETSAIFVCAIDVTDQVRARRAAEEANQAKGAFLASMSHELRTPLNAIGGYVDLIEMGVRGPITDEVRSDLGRIKRGQQHLLALINDLLNFAKLEAGKVDYQLADVRLSDAVAAVLPLIEPQRDARALTVDVMIPPELTARADPEKLGQILVNLLSNAVKFTEVGGHITIEAPEANAAFEGGVALSVRDTGIGIPAEKLDAIFEPFVQVNTNRAGSRGGTGLGLAISRDLARGMGGELTCESVPGSGSRFTLTLRTTA
jgi:signal transduction histidine kinase